MRGKHCGMHPASVMGGKRPPCARKDKHVEVYESGDGFLMVGCSDLSQACRILADYVNDISEWRFFARNVVRDAKGSLACSVFAGTEPGAMWDPADVEL